MQLHPSTNIILKESDIHGAGRGVFASKNVSKGEILELCPVIVLPSVDYPIAKQTTLRNYYFMWGEQTAALCLGYGSLYNHSYEPNASYRKIISRQLIEFIAIKNITKGQEITVNYNYGNPDDKSKLWIDDIPGPID